MRRLLAGALAALALTSCIPLGTCPDERSAGRGPAGDIARGTVRSVLAAPEAPEPWEDTYLSYDDPADGERRELVVVRLDDGREVTLEYAGPRQLAPGERVRVHLGEPPFLL